MEDQEIRLWTKKNIITLLLLGILLLIIPVGVKLVQEQQLLKLRAAVEAITFTGPGVSSDGSTTSSLNFKVELRSPLGPPVDQ